MVKRILLAFLSSLEKDADKKERQGGKKCQNSITQTRYTSHFPNFTLFRRVTKHQFPQAVICHFANHLGWDKCDGSPKMVIAFSWKPTQVCLYATWMLQHIAHADLEHLEKAVQGPSTSLFTDLPRGHQMVCYFLLSTACHQQRNPTCWKQCFLEISQQATDVRFLSVTGLASFLQCVSGTDEYSGWGRLLF